MGLYVVYNTILQLYNTHVTTNDLYIDYSRLFVVEFRLWFVYVHYVSVWFWMTILYYVRVYQKNMPDNSTNQRRTDPFLLNTSWSLQRLHICVCVSTGDFTASRPFAGKHSTFHANANVLNLHFWNINFTSRHSSEDACFAPTHPHNCTLRLKA